MDYIVWNVGWFEINFVIDGLYCWCLDLDYLCLIWFWESLLLSLKTSSSVYTSQMFLSSLVNTSPSDYQIFLSSGIQEDQ